MTSKYGTSFQESEAFLAATMQDAVEINRLLDQMLPREVTAVRQACNFLHDLVSSRLERLAPPRGNDGH